MDDEEPEPLRERFNVTISSDDPPVVFMPPMTTVTIEDDDGGCSSLSSVAFHKLGDFPIRVRGNLKLDGTY